jgi:hypothetical protein
MNTNRIALIVLLVFVLIAATGCGTSRPSHFYTLDSMASPEGAPAASYAVAVGPVSIPAAVDRPQFVVQAGPNRVAIDEFNRWAAPLDDSIARVVAGNLSALLGTPRVARASLANFDPAYRVTLDVQRFESIPGESALVDVVWAVRASAGGAMRSGRTVAREAAQGQGFDTLAAALSRALAKVSGDIAAAIRAEEDKHP